MEVTDRVDPRRVFQRARRLDMGYALERIALTCTVFPMMRRRGCLSRCGLGRSRLGEAISERRQIRHAEFPFNVLPAGDEPMEDVSPSRDPLKDKMDAMNTEEAEDKVLPFSPLPWHSPDAPPSFRPSSPMAVSFLEPNRIPHPPPFGDFNINAAMEDAEAFLRSDLDLLPPSSQELGTEV